jgi:hypothetical protein
METKQNVNWIEKEFSTADLSDERLNLRLQNLASQLAQAPSLPINRASQDWASTKAAYL